MVRMPQSFRQRIRGGFTSALALALMAGGAAVLGSAATSAPAMAQAKPKYSKEFVKVYEPAAAIANSPTGDYASAKPQLPGIVAAVANNDDRYAAGSLVLLLGNKLADSALQRQGLELMLASGKVAPEQVGQFQYFVGNLAYAAKDWAAARTALQAGIAAGYTADNPEGLIAESYFNENNTTGGLAYLKQTIAARAASGTPAPEAWLLRGLKMAYEADLRDEALDWSTMLVKANPTERNWLQSLQVVGAAYDFQPQEQLDLLRLMLHTKALSTRSEYTNYIETVDPRIAPNEVSTVLSAAVAAGVMTTGDTYYGEVKRVVDQRLPGQAKEAADYAKEAAGAATGKPAENAGDIYFSMGNYAQAEAMYQLALQKGTADRNQTLTRLGMTQALQGKAQPARETLGQVSGNRAPVAKMWTAYVDSKA